MRCTGKEGFVRFPDGRVACNDCIDTAVFDSDEAKVVYLEIVDYMEHELSLRMPPGIREIPVLAVDVPALQAQTRSQSRYGHGGGSSQAPSTLVRGLTISTCGQVQHFHHSAAGSSRPASIFQQFPAEVKVAARPSLVSLPSSVFFIEEKRSVTAILVLVGMPRLLTASVLAHEATHAYCKLSVDMAFQLPGKVEEGLCQYISYEYLEYIQSVTEQARQRPAIAATEWKDRLARAGFAWAIDSLLGFGIATNADVVGMDEVLWEEVKALAADGSAMDQVRQQLALSLATSPSTSSTSSSALLSYLKYQIETDPTPVRSADLFLLLLSHDRYVSSQDYGDGFREAAHTCGTWTLAEVIGYIKDHQRFPPARSR